MLSEVGYAGPISVRDTTHLFDLDAFRRQHPLLPANIKELSLDWSIFGPLHLLYREHMCSQSGQDMAKLRPRECVCFVFGLGQDDEDRCTTRIGGLPFWPRGLTWPKAQKEGTKQFIAQIDFRNIFWPEKLPGDILSVHYDEDWEGDGRFEGAREGGGATLTWHNSQTVTELIPDSDLPPPNRWYQEPGPFYGPAVLTNDHKLPDTEWDDNSSAIYPEWFTLHGTKIGGHAFLFGDNWQEQLEGIADPVFLCSVGSYQVKYITNGGLPKKGKWDEHTCNDHWWLDMGIMNIFYPKGHPEDLHWHLYMP